MKQEIIVWFETSRKFNTGKVLYRKYGMNKAYARMFNMSGATKVNLDILIEEFRLMAGLSFVELNAILKKPIKKATVEPKAEIVTNELSKKETKTVPLAEIKSNPQLRVRAEFPFLNDPKCPDELTLMVGHKMAAYYGYKNGHPMLSEASTEQEQFEAVRQVVESYIVNQSLYKELNYYKKFHKILGEDKFFDKLNLLNAFAKLSTEELVKKKDNLSKYILRDEDNLRDPKKEHLRLKTSKRIDQRRWELKEVEEMLKTRN